MHCRLVAPLSLLALTALGLPAFAADRILIDHAGPSVAALYIANADGSDERALTQPGTLDYNPAWSSKGDWIAFTSERGSSAWSPDGSRILFTSSRMGFKDEALLTNSPQSYGEIFVMNADGTHVEQLTDNQWEDGGPAWLAAKVTPSTAVAAKH